MLFYELGELSHLNKLITQHFAILMLIEINRHKKDTGYNKNINESHNTTE